MPRKGQGRLAKEYKTVKVKSKKDTDTKKATKKK